ncbi:MAG: helix-turn-helix domain-containing protein [Alphaproteobacteria bacterium]|nr:helix-turn-helix domain-containing protein [Alphaproteobacteria bacterium]
MARSYSLDLRERVVLTVLSGASCRSVATIFGVSPSSVIKWSQRYRATGVPSCWRQKASPFDARA